VARLQVARPRYPALRFDPFTGVFRLLTSIRFAILNIGLVALAAILGVAIPQMPGFVRVDPALRADWVRTHDAYGPLTAPMDNLQLFEVFHSWWFYSLFGLLLASVAVCSVSRFRPIWRSIHHPPITVNDRYFETAHYRAQFPTVSPESLTYVLQKHRYAVKSRTEDGRTYLYADRFGWAKLGTFATHLSLLILMTGGLLTWHNSYSADILIPQGATRPVLDPSNPTHPQVGVLSFTHTKDAEGRDIQVASRIAVYQHGQEVAEGQTTINDPLHYGGFTFHQAAYAETGVALQMRDPVSGQVLYSDTLNLFGQLPVPRVRIADATGTVLFDDMVPPTFFPDDQSGAAPISLPGSDGVYYVGVRRITNAPAGQPPWQLVVSTPGGGVGQASLHGSAAVGDIKASFEDLTAGNYLLSSDIPGSNGQDTLIEHFTGADGKDVLLVISPDGAVGRATADSPGTFKGMGVDFLGTRAFSGITVRRDPGANWIWIGVVLLLAGLLCTFYIPRRRLWLKIAGETTYAAGSADRGQHLTRELLEIAREAGSPVPAFTSNGWDLEDDGL
jgi:cytochrome c biogenesis protein